MDPVDRLTLSIARTIGDGPGPARRARQRRAVARLSARPSGYHSMRWFVPLAAALVLLVWLGRRPSSPALTNTAVDPTPTAGAWFTATDRPVPVALADRSRITLAPHAKVQLAASAPDLVELKLERGRLDVVVPPDPLRAWRVFSGPFTVAVTGTTFTVDWQPDTVTLSVVVAEGEVHVQGGNLPDAGTRVSAGQRFVTPPTTTIALRPTPPSTSPPTPRRTRSWQQLALDGHHAAALAAAEREGFAALIDRIEVAELDLLAHSARLARAARRTTESLQALRRRFPRDHRAHTAAFLLGRVALELANDATTAAAWFAKYVEESPQGTLAADARARRLEILHDIGDYVGARAAAGDYLQYHPNGSGADLARSILGHP